MPKKSNIKNKIKKFWKLGSEEYNTSHFDVNSNGELLVREGNFQYNIFELIKKYGTPTEIVFPTIIENRVRDLIDTFSAYIKILGYKGKFFYHYAMKVNQNREFVLPAVAEGANLEVSSANELYLTKKMLEQEKFNEKIRVICNGPKTPKYIALINELRNRGLSIIPIIEEYNELEALKKFKGDIGIRLNMNIRIGAHWDKKFNRFGFTEEEIYKLGKIKNLAVLHYHLSSQIEKIEGIISPLKKAIEIYARLKEKNPTLDTIDIGGGAGIPYEKKKHFYKAKTLIQQVVKTTKHYADKFKIKHPNLMVEWGRYVAAPAQITIYKILAEKPIENKNDKKWYIIDGSFMNDLVDTWAIHQKWHVTPVNNLNTKKLQKVWLVGSSCDSDDKYTAGGSYILLPKLDETKELYIAFFDTGAYQDSLSSHHCLLSSPLKLVVSNGEVRIARKRETPEDIGKLFGW
jgi:arginine decarboxylase